MPLRRFPVAGVEEMLRALSGREVPPQLAEVIFEGTEGNPFFVEEVFRHLAEEGKLFDAQGAWRESLRVDELEVPEGVRLVIGRRLARLKEDTRRVLTTAAVVGRSFGIRLLEEMESAQSDAVLDAVEEAEHVKLVSAEPGREERYRFVHELVRQTLAETLTQARRQRLHARIADAIEKVHSANPERQASALAHHLFAAGRSADAGKTLQYLTIAAKQAAAAAAYSEALTHLDNALTVVGDDQPSVAASLQVQRAAALRSLMRYPEAIQAYESALTLFAAAGDRVQYAATSIPLGYIHGWALDVRRARVILKRALDHLGDPGSPLSRPLLSLSAACASVGGDMDTALAELEESAKLGSETADPATNAFVWSCEAHTRYHAMQLDRAAEASVKASRAFEAAGDAWGHVDADYVQVFANMFFGKPDELPQFVAEAVRRAERVGHQYSSWACKSGLVHLHAARGDLAQAEVVGRENLAFAQSFYCVYGFQSEVALANTLLLRGQVEESKDLFARAMADSWPRSAWDGHAAACAAWASAMLGEAGASRAALEARCRLPGSGRELNIGQWFSLAPVIVALTVSGQREEAAGLLAAAERLVGLGAVFTHLMTRTAAGIAAACAAEWSRAEEHHQAAIRQAEALRFHLAGASARGWHAEMLLSRNDAGDRARGRALLGEALAGFEKAGATLLATRASRRLVDCG
jgi:tetratricopeptide (TPR) repeat protein